MNTVAAKPPSERADLFRETAGRIGLPPALVEKDFWVCWTLKQLFTIESLRSSLMFKGGTSLSKAFGLIRRFSEDIDLAVDYAPLGFTGDRDPAQEMSRNRREKLLDEMMSACHRYIAGPFLNALQKHISDVLPRPSEWKLALSRSDPNTVEFRYPAALTDSPAYIRPAVVLELGTHAELIPSDRYTIKPYAADEFPKVFVEPECHVMAIKPERTFWEKATILHAEYHRPKESSMPARYSRHYYDMAMLAVAPVRSTALADFGLLKRVLQHKKKFYASARAQYDLAVPGTLRLSPMPARLKELGDDYEKMKIMIFDEAPPFDTVLEAIRALEAEINGFGDR